MGPPEGHWTGGEPVAAAADPGQPEQIGAPVAKRVRVAGCQSEAAAPGAVSGGQRPAGA